MRNESSERGRTGRLPAIVALVALAASAHGAERAWNGGIGSWSDPAQWTPAGVPEPSDDLRIDGGSVQMDGAVTVGHRLTWTGGAVHSGLLRIAPGATAVLEGAADKLMQQCVLVNAGELKVLGGRLVCQITGYSQSVVSTNEAGGTFELEDTGSVAQINSGWPAALRFVNDGRLRKTGAGASQLMGIPLHNRGRTEVEGGSLLWTGGGISDGVFTVRAGSEITLHTGGFDLTGSRWEGAGPARITGSATLQGTFLAENFGFEAGTLDGSFEVSGAFTWSGGVFQGGCMRLGAGQHVIAGPDPKELVAASLANTGQLVISAAGVGLRLTGYNQAISVTNEAGATLTLEEGAILEQRNNGGWSPAQLALINHGTLRSQGAATNRIQSVPLHNHGTLEIVDGVLLQSGGGTSPGKALITAPARLEIGGGTYDLTGAEWAGSGAAWIVATSGLVGAFHADHFGLAGGDVDGVFELTGGFYWIGGRLVGARARLGPGTHRVYGEAQKALHSASLSNAGHLVVDSSTIRLLFTGYNQAALLTNEVGGILELAGTAGIDQQNPGGWSPAGIGVFNDGTMRISGAGLKSLTAVPLHNRGHLAVLDGTLQQSGGGTLPGTAAIAASGRLELSGGTYQLDGSRWAGPGPVAIVGSVALGGAFAAEHFRLESGDLSGECRISGGFHWTGGRLIGAQVRLGAGEHHIAGTEPKTILSGTLANEGHLVFGATTVRLQFTGYNQVATVTNEGSGQLDLLGGARLEQWNGGGWTPAGIGLVNSGVLCKPDPGTATLAAVPLINRGACAVPSGALRIESTATFESTGHLTVGLGSEPAVQITGTATLAGTLQAETPAGFQVSTGATFTPLTAETVSGQFTNPMTLNPGHIYRYANSYTARAVTLTAEEGLAQPVQLLATPSPVGAFRFEIHGQSGLIYLIESSTDMVSWQLDEQLIAQADVITIQPENQETPARFFRIGLLP